MESIVLVASILAIHFFAWLTPGPLTVLIIRNSLMYSRTTGVWTAVGIALGNVVHITYTVIALTLLTSFSAVVFTVIKYLGVAYLIYLATQTFLAKPRIENAEASLQRAELTPFQAMKTGFVVNILSPKAPPFFASIFAAVFAADAPLWVVVFLWVAMPLNTFLMACIQTFFFTHSTIRATYAKYERIVNSLLAATLFLLAIFILFYI